MTDLTTPHARWVRCPDPDCRQRVYNTSEDRDAHLAWHDKLDDRFAELRRSVIYIGKEIDGIRNQLAESRPVEGTLVAAQEDVEEWPEDELEPDTGPEPVVTGADLAPPFAELTADTTTDAADLHDITSTDDDLEQRIANLTSPVNVHTQPGI